jgi:hypothetical protein
VSSISTVTISGGCRPPAAATGPANRSRRRRSRGPGSPSGLAAAGQTPFQPPRRGDSNARDLFSPLQVSAARRSTAAHLPHEPWHTRRSASSSTDPSGSRSELSVNRTLPRLGFCASRNVNSSPARPGRTTAFRTGKSGGRIEPLPFDRVTGLAQLQLLGRVRLPVRDGELVRRPGKRLPDRQKAMDRREAQRPGRRPVTSRPAGPGFDCPAGEFRVR